MKKNVIRITAAVLASLSLIACHKDTPDNPDGPETTFEEVLKANRDFFQKQSPTGEYFFYEVECILNGKFSELPADSIHVKTARSIAGLNDGTKDMVYYIDTDFETGTNTVSSEPGHWEGSFFIEDWDAITITFQDAVRILKSQAILDLPASDKCTFRHPMGNVPHPLYIFGSSQAKPFVGVDAVTGQIGTLKSIGMSGLSEQFIVEP